MGRKKTAGTAVAVPSPKGNADTTIYTHNLWLNYLKPVSIGLVFSPNALRSAQVELPSQSSEAQRAIEALATLRPAPDDPEGENLVRTLRDPLEFLREFLGWKPEWLEVYRPAPGARMFAGQHLLPPRHDLPEPPADLCKELPNHGDTLAPTFAYRWSPTVTGQMENAPKVCILGLEVPDYDQQNHPIDLDRKPPEADDEAFHESPQKKFERLLYETQVPVGLIFQGRQIRLVYKPESQQSGYITFPLDALLKPAGRLACTALRDLLRHQRLQTLPSRQRLHHILGESRKFQNEVSTRLAEQVLAALFELLKGFEAADEESRQQLLKGLRDVPARTHEIYEGLLTVLMRLVFLLYAEEREMFPGDALFRQNYSLAGLFDRLVQDEAQHPDTMDQRYGAWPHLVALFRLVYQGVTYRLGPSSPVVKIPERKGDLFDPERFPFLEGRTQADPGTPAGELPRIPDGVILRVLRNLLYLNEERLSYRALEVEQIGSVYETIMGFRVETARGRSVAIRPDKKSGAPVTISLEELLDEPGARRAKWLKEQTGQEIGGKSATALKDAATESDLVAALGRLVDARLTPAPVPKGALVFQPSPERRRTGSHYTPSTLTRPIVEKALEPVLARLGASPTPDQILALKVCDPAMGSGAFLVQALRQLAARLVKAWEDHEAFPRIPADETPLLFASRLIAQRCLYGVDKNPMAVNLAKLSLWLETLARDHAFTFLDHNLRHGDSLVGLSLAQIDACHWNVAEGGGFVSAKFREHIEAIAQIRRLIGTVIEASELCVASEKSTFYRVVSKLQKHSDSRLEILRNLGDAIIGTFFQGGPPKVVEANRKNLANTIRDYLDDEIDSATRLVLRTEIDIPASRLKGIEPAVTTFHWELEFPEVFLHADETGHLVRLENDGFDAVVGNPPFAGKNTISDGAPAKYLDWLKVLHPGAHGNADVVAHFFRRAFQMLRNDGAFGLIATNTIGQGDTRSTGLRWICEHDGMIYSASRRLKWPGSAAVVVSVVHVAKGVTCLPVTLDGRNVERVTAYLFRTGGHDSPSRLLANTKKSFIGSYVLGMGFTFDDSDKSGVASSISVMKEIISKNPENQNYIMPYIG